MLFHLKEQQAIYDALSPKNKAHVDFMASLKELDRSGFLVSTLNPYSYDIEVIPLYTTVRKRRFFFFSKMVTTVRWQWTYRKKDKDGLTVDLQMGYSDFSEDYARHEAYKLVQNNAANFTVAKLQEINDMDD